MDGVSIAASVFTILQTTKEVIDVLKHVKNAPEECQRCQAEATTLQSLLNHLLFHLNDSSQNEAWYANVRELTVGNGPLNQYRQTLERLLSKAEIPDSIHNFKRRLRWTFTNKEVENIFARMEHLESVITIALEIDSFKLSQAIKRDTVVVHGALTSLQATSTTIVDIQSQQKHEAVLEWLSPTDFPAQQHNIISRRQLGTAQWFLESVSFKQWAQGTKSTLYCTGIPGAGKTMMTAVAIDHLSYLYDSDTVGIAYIFCNYKTQAEQTTSDFVAALLKQLARTRLETIDPVTKLYDKHAKRGSRPTLDEFRNALTSVCASFSVVYILVDALDECSKLVRDRLIQILKGFQSQANVHLLFTSRFIPEVNIIFTLDPRIEIQATRDDVMCFIDGQIPQLPNCIRCDEGLKDQVRIRIVEAVEGMFLLAKLLVDSLLDKRTKHRVLTTLDDMSKGQTLDKAYDNAVKRIEGQLPEDRWLAMRMICWISCSQRPLTTKELSHALAVEPGDKKLNTDNIADISDIFEVCAGLVTVDGSTVSLVHYTTQEYFEKVRLESSSDVQKEIAVACLTCLSFDEFKIGSCADTAAYYHRSTKYDFLKYAAVFWGEHVRPVEHLTSELAMKLLSDKALVDSLVQVIYAEDLAHDDDSQRFPRGFTAIHLSSYHGLPCLTQRLLNRRDGDTGITANSCLGGNRSPLYLALLQGHEAVVKVLLDAGADVNVQGGSCSTPLQAASTQPKESVVELLLDAGADGQAQGGLYCTALQAASVYSNGSIVKLLLDAGADVHARGGKYGTALQAASAHSSESIVELLLQAGADVNAQGGYHMNALLAAVANSNDSVIKLLLTAGTDVDVQDAYHNSALQVASARQSQQGVKLLLEAGADVNGQGGYWGNGILAGSMLGREDVVRLLLDHGADPWLHSPSGCLPLQAALVRGHWNVVRTLLEAMWKDDKGSVDATSSAAKEIPEDVSSLPDVLQKNRRVNGWSLLHWACRSAKPPVIKALLACGLQDEYKAIGNPPQLWSAYSIAQAHQNQPLLCSKAGTTTSVQSTIPEFLEPKLFLKGKREWQRACDGCSFEILAHTSIACPATTLTTASCAMFRRERGMDSTNSELLTLKMSGATVNEASVFARVKLLIGFIALN